MLRLAISVLAVFAIVPAFAAEPDLSTPAAAMRAYLNATKANDVESAKKCWTIDDNDAAGALDVIAGMWIASRKLVAATEARFGDEGVKMLGRWNRPSCSDAAIELTLTRLGVPEAHQKNDIAWFKVAWQPGDGESNAVFMQRQSAYFFRRIGGQWKLDGNVFTDCERASSLFEPGKLWPVWRDEMAVMNELTAAIDSQKLTKLQDFARELKDHVEVLKAKYESKR